MPTTVTIPITPGSGQNLDATQLTVNSNTVAREVTVIGDPTTAANYAAVNANGQQLVEDAADGATGAAVPTVATLVGGTDGTDLRALSTNASGQLQVEAVSGSTTAVTQGTAANLLCKADIVGNGGATLDGTIAAGTAPTNGLGILAQYNSSGPAPTAAQTVSLQADSSGNLFVNNLRRSQVKPVAGSIASTTAATLLAAQATGIFADLSGLVLTVDPTTAVAGFSVNISDGTTTYKFWFDVGTVPSTTVQNNIPPLAVTFDPPIPATSAATAWTIALSVADATVFYVATFTLQKAA